MKNRSKKPIFNAELTLSILALVVSAVSLFLSTYYSQRGIKTNIRPTLVFVYSDKTGWVIRNVGSGPALNILVANRPSSDSQWQIPVRLYPLKPGDETPLKWIDIDSKVLGASFQDADNRYYTSICDNDLTTFYEGNQLPGWDKAGIKNPWEVQKE